MTQKLIPRLTSQQAGRRLEELQDLLGQGRRPLELVLPQMTDAVPNPTGGEAASHEDLVRWRRQVVDQLRGWNTGSKSLNDRHGARLGRAISQVIDPIPSDAAHDGVWSFLSLNLFPDVVFARWPPESGTTELSKDRWIGAQLARDRNYLKLSWRRWQVLGPVMESAAMPLGEDEFGALLERTSVARNVRLVRAAAREIVAFSTHNSRMDFAREFMKILTFQTGPLNLDVLDDSELAELIRDASEEASTLSVPRRAIPDPVDRN